MHFIGSVEDVHWSPTEEGLLASCSCDGTIKLWDTRASPADACVCTVEKAHSSDVNVISWNSHEPLLVTGGDDAELRIWSLKTIQFGQPVARFKYHSGPITSVEWMPQESTTFMASGEDDQVTIWDIAVEPDSQESVEGVPPQLMFLHLGQKEINFRFAEKLKLPFSGMLEIEGIGSEVVTAFFVITLSIAALSIFVSAWRLTGRRPLFYDLFLVEIHSWGARRFVQVLQLGQEFRPLGSWSEVMARMRSRARSQVQTNTNDSSTEAPVAFDTNVVIQSPATVMDESTASIPPPSSSTLWEIEMPVATSGGGSDVSHESHFAAAAAIAVLGRGGFQATSSGTMDVVPGIPSISAVGVSSVIGENSNDTSQRSHGTTSIVMPVNISVVNDELESNQVQDQGGSGNNTTAAQQPDSGATNTSQCSSGEDKHEEEDHGNSPVEAEGDSVIRLKFLDDTQRDARTTMTDTIGKFKSVHFGDAVAAGRVVRLIYQGQLLREDSRTLASYGLRDGCVVHCHISNTPYARHAPSTSVPVSYSSGLRHRDAAPNSAPSTSNANHEAQEFRYPRWAVAVLLYTYRFPLIGVPLDAIIRFMFDRQMAPSAEPGVFRRTYQRAYNAVFGPSRDDGISPLDRAADAAARAQPQPLCLGDYLLWIFAGQFVAVWGLFAALPAHLMLRKLRFEFFASLPIILILLQFYDMNWFPHFRVV
nr:WD40 repeat and Ubiquitin domain containing protein [Haemonchus contortus]